MRRAAVVIGALLLVTVPAFADAPAPPPAAAVEAVPDALMAGLANHATRFEDMKRRGAFTFSGKMEQLDEDGSISETKEITLRSTPTPTPMDRITEVIKFLDDGKDKTKEAQEKSDERRAKRLKDPSERKKEEKKDIHLPFLPSEQSRYVFQVAEHDANNPHRLRVAFAPKVPAEDAYKGSAWVDDASGDILSVGFSFSKNPMFVDHIEIKIAFGLPTPLGSAPQHVSFDGRGGLLFIHRHYRGVATLSDPRVAF